MLWLKMPTSAQKAQKEDAEAEADHGVPRTVPRTHIAEEGRMGPEEAHDRASAARAYGDSDTSVSTSDSQNEDPDELTPKGAALDTPRKTQRICTTEEGWTCLEATQLIEPGEALGSNVLASALIQISLFPGMSQAMRDSVRTVMLLMAKAAPADVGEDTIGGIVDCVVDRLSDAVKAATQAGSHRHRNQVHIHCVDRVLHPNGCYGHVVPQCPQEYRHRPGCNDAIP